MKKKLFYVSKSDNISSPPTLPPSHFHPHTTTKSYPPPLHQVIPFGRHQHLLYIIPDIDRIELVAIANHWFPASVDKKLLEIPANIVHLQIVVVEAIG